MKLALITETFPPEINGVAMTFGVLAAELARRGHEVTVYHPRRDDLPAAALDPSYRRVPLPGFPIPRYPMLRLGLPAFRRLSRLWQLHRPDLVHVATEGPLGYTAVLAARRLGLAVTSSFHTKFDEYTRHYGFPLIGGLTLGWLRYVHNLTRCTFVPTAELRTQLAARGFQNLRILSRGIDTRLFNPQRRSEELRAQWQAGPHNPVVLHVGRLAPEKNYGLLFKIYAAMRTANPNLRFVLAGDGPLRAKILRDHPECRHVGFTPREEIGRYYASADIYVHPSLTETFGNVVPEALASGLAVAGFDYAAARQFIHHGENGLVAARTDPEGLQRAAVQLATDAALRSRLGRAACAIGDGRSWSEVTGQFEQDLARAAGLVPRATTVAA